MENELYTDDFEQLLRDTTNDFRMYPSRKVWHSIYNDLHPDRRWPSFAVCLLLITSILYVGINNNNAINADAEKLLVSTLSPVSTTASELNILNINSLPGQKVTTLDFAGNIAPSEAEKNNSTNNLTMPQIASLNSTKINNTNIVNAARKDLVVSVNSVDILPALNTENKTKEIINILSSNITLDTKNSTAFIIDDSKKEAKENIAINNAPIKDPESLMAADEKNIKEVVTDEVFFTPPVIVKNTSLSQLQSNIKTRNTEDVVWIEDYAFHNKRNSNKWKTHLSSLIYVTPSVGYRIFNKNNGFEPSNALLIRSAANTVNADESINQQAALNLEAGTAFILDLSKRIRIKAGLQFNFTNYITYAQKLNHPTQTNVLINDQNTNSTLLVPYSAIYANKPGNNFAKLNNKTVQFSIPAGADFKVAGKDKLKWYVGATIQPTYVAGGNAYLVSSDYKNYVDVPSMLRSWNLNTGIEAFVSFKTKNGSLINLGPQFRYQLLSTYSDKYTYSEKLYNIGIKLGITRKL